MKHLGFSVGGMKIAGLLGSAIAVKESGYKPDVISGNSSGAIVALLYALDKLSFGENIIKNNFNQTHLFPLKPFSIRGLLFGMARLAVGKNSLTYFKLDTILRLLVTKKEFDKYKKDKNSIPVYIEAVSINDGSKAIWNLKNYDYEDAIRRIIASCSIPLFVPAVRIDGHDYVDGGLRDYVVSNEIYNMFIINESVTVYAKPINNEVIKTKKVSIKNIISNTYEIGMTEIAKDDQRRELMTAIYKNIKLKQIFLPRVLKGIFDDNQERLNELFIKAYTITENKLK